MEIIDLSQTICDGMPVFEGDPPVSLELRHRSGAIPYNTSEIRAGLHAGTHVDMPLHFFEAAMTADKFLIRNFTGRACLADARGVWEIGPSVFEKADIRRDDIVILLTGHDRKYGTAEYFQKWPFLSVPAAELLVKAGIKMLGIDAPSPDNAPFEVHMTLLGAGIFILENLTGLERLLHVGSFEISAVPLKICAEASPVRAYARISA